MLFKMMIFAIILFVTKSKGTKYKRLKCKQIYFSSNVDR